MVHFIILDIFTTIPTTQYVRIGETATFECATNIAGYTLVFNIPGIMPQLYNGPVPGNGPTGGQKATATFTATLNTNGTNVTCGALDAFFNPVGVTDTVYLFIQGIE